MLSALESPNNKNNKNNFSVSNSSQHNIFDSSFSGSQIGHINDDFQPAGGYYETTTEESDSTNNNNHNNYSITINNNYSSSHYVEEGNNVEGLTLQSSHGGAHDEMVEESYSLVPIE